MSVQEKWREVKNCTFDVNEAKRDYDDLKKAEAEGRYLWLSWGCARSDIKESIRMKKKALEKWRRASVREHFEKSQLNRLEMRKASK